jgi:hypothetical protein
MKKLVLASLIIAALSSATSSHAQLSTTTYADQATWNATSANGYSQIDGTTATPQATAVNNTGSLSLGAANNVMVQTFTPTTTYTLGAFAIYAAGGAVTNATVHLFATTIAPGSWATTGGFNVAQNANTNDLFNVGNLGAGLTFSYSGTATQNYLEFDLGAANQVTLTAGTTYDLEFWAPSSTVANTLFWRRTSLDVYANGNAYAAGNGSGYTVGSPGLQTSRNDISGSGRRDAALELYAVPEPASLALMGLGALVGTFVIRRRTS